MPQRAFGPLAKATVEVKGVVLVGDTERVNRSIANIVEVNRGTQRLLRHRKTPAFDRIGAEEMHQFVASDSKCSNRVTIHIMRNI